MCGRSSTGGFGPGTHSRSRRPGPALVELLDRLRHAGRVDVEPARQVAEERQQRRWEVDVGHRISSNSNERDLDRRDGGEVARDLAPALALVGAREDLARAGAEVQARHVVGVDREPLTQDAEVRVALRQALGRAAANSTPHRWCARRPRALRACSGRARGRAGSRRSSRGRAGAPPRRSRSRTAGPR